MSDWGWFSGAPSTSAAGVVTSGTTGGTALSVPGANNTKGAYTQLLASAPFDCAGMLVTSVQGASSQAQHALIDIAVGAASSEVVVVPNLPSMRQSTTTIGAAPRFVPCAIASGARISARYQCSTATGSTLSVALALIPAGGSYPIRAQSALALGANTATSKGLVVDPGGTANTKGAYAELTASHGHASQWALLTVQNSTAVTQSGWALDVAIGAASSETIVAPDITFLSSSSVGLGVAFAFMPLALPADVRVAVRAQCANNTAGSREIAVVLHTFA